MTDGNGGVVRWPDLMRVLDQKAEMRDISAVGDQVRGLRAEMREQFGVVNKRIDHQEERREEERVAAQIRQRTLLLTIVGAAVSILAAFIGSGQLG